MKYSSCLKTVLLFFALSISIIAGGCEKGAEGLEANENESNGKSSDDENKTGSVGDSAEIPESDIGEDSENELTEGTGNSTDSDAEADEEKDSATEKAPKDTDDKKDDSDAQADTGVKYVQIISELPEGFTLADPVNADSSYGGFTIIGPLDEDAVHDEDELCANVIRVVMRDFTSNHGDFQDDWTNSAVEVTLGDDQKPVALAESIEIDGQRKENTSQIETEWYRNVEDINLPFAVDLWLEPVGDTFVFDSSNFFPLDGVGFDETCICGDYAHNFHFTTEMHANFKYNGGEEFTFIGDDDVYVYVNNKLVVDLGGVHIPETGTVLMDEVAEELSLVIGEVYPIDLFQAERQTCGSNFRIETTLDFSGCGVILPGDIILE